jgi:site-specific DNA recombinase
MKDIGVFTQFVKKGTLVAEKRDGDNCVIYTRVSTKEQAENNMSLETQKRACEQYANKSNYTTLACFGGTYESAKTDERKEFKRMLDFVRKSKDKVSFIIVYSVDRFSRTGANGMYIASELRKQGITVHAVSQPADTRTASGRLQQNIHFIFSEYDNELRRDKAVTGMREKVSKGYWIGRPPVGYNSLRSDGIQKLVVNEKGAIIRKAFEWKAKEGITDVEIIKRLKKYDFKISPQTLSFLLKNPFYCGILTHAYLDGKIIQGQHEPLISKELFLQVNEITSLNPHDYKQTKESEPHPLRKFVKCADCGTSFAGYIVKAKGIHYYKCSKKGCKCNRNAEKMHELFQSFLKPYSLDERLIPLFRDELVDNFHEMNQHNAEQEKTQRKELEVLNSKIDTLDERYGLGEITREIYEKFAPKYKAERRAIEAELKRSDFDLSNLEEYVDMSLHLAANLHKIWKLGSYTEREKLQFLLFPNGILYDRKINGYRTTKTNSVFELIHSLSEDLTRAKKGEADQNVSFSNKVEDNGLEPMTSSMPWKRSTN